MKNKLFIITLTFAIGLITQNAFAMEKLSDEQVDSIHASMSGNIPHKDGQDSTSSSKHAYNPQNFTRADIQGDSISVCGEILSILTIRYLITNNFQLE